MPIVHYTLSRTITYLMLLDISYRFQFDGSWYQHLDASEIVNKYRDNPLVVRKNDQNVNFATPIKVYIHMQDTPIPEPEIEQTTPTSSLATRYRALCASHHEAAERRIGERNANR